jgi:PP-loop superfamily ATP-utilizing enzyme
MICFQLLISKFLGSKNYNQNNEENQENRCYVSKKYLKIVILLAKLLTVLSFD